MNAKRVEHLWPNDSSCIRLRPEYPNHVWSYDFVEGRTHNGRKILMLNVIDEFTRECITIGSSESCRPSMSWTCFPTSSSCVASRHIFGPTTVRSSPPRHCAGIDPRRSVPRPPTLRRAVPEKTAIARASTPSFGTNCSTAKSSTRSRVRRKSNRSSESIARRTRSSLRNGDVTTTPCGLTHP